MARFGRMSERFDLGVLVSPVLLAERQTWITPLFGSTWSQVSLRSSPGRRPTEIDRVKSASSRRLLSSASPMPSWERHECLSSLGVQHSPRPAALMMRRNERRMLAASSGGPMLVAKTRSLLSWLSRK